MKHRGAIGDDRLNKFARYRALLREQREITDRIAEEMDVQVETVAQATLPGDSRRLRGIPIFAKGVSGVQTDNVVPGSDEHLDAMDVA